MKTNRLHTGSRTQARARRTAGLAATILALLGTLQLTGAGALTSVAVDDPPPTPALPLPFESTSVRPHAPPIDTYQWEHFTTKDGLPSDKVFAVRVDGERVWAGTDQGLAVLDDGAFQSFSVDDGLAHSAVLAIDVDPATGTVWLATMGGLNSLSAGRFRTFNQFNSGLSNDVVYAVTVDDKYVWTATASGASRLNTRTEQWEIYNEMNAPMHEPWTYSVAAGSELVFVAAWGGGVLEFNKETETWKDYVDPDGEMELDIFPDDGLVHDVTSSVAYEDGVLWAATYFGLSRYDGLRWKGYFDDSSGLVSNFINFVRARGPEGWLCTDSGLSRFDGSTWWTYRRTESGDGEVVITDQNDRVRRLSTDTAIAHNFVLGVDFQGDAIWVATEKGLSRGRPLSGGERASSFGANDPVPTNGVVPETFEDKTTGG